MPYIANRSAVLLVPQEAALAWLNSLPEQRQDKFSLEEMREEPEVILIPAYEEDDELELVMDGIWKELFEAELQSWCADKALWPKDMSREVFLDWFEFTPFSFVRDQAKGPIELEKS